MEGVTNVIPGPHSQPAVSSSPLLSHTELTLEIAETTHHQNTILGLVVMGHWTQHLIVTLSRCSDSIIRTPSRTSQPIRILAAIGGEESEEVSQDIGFVRLPLLMSGFTEGGRQTRKCIVWMLGGVLITPNMLNLFLVFCLIAILFWQLDDDYLLVEDKFSRKLWIRPWRKKLILHSLKVD